MNNVFDYLNYVFINTRAFSMYKKIYYNNIFYLTYGVHNILWSKETFFDLIYKLKYYLGIPSECIVLSIIYMKRLVIKGLVITELNIRNIFIVCISLAYKFLIDYSICTKIYSTITRIPVKYLLNMEIYIIKMLEHKIFVNLETYNQTYTMILQDYS